MTDQPTDLTAALDNGGVEGLNLPERPEVEERRPQGLTAADRDRLARARAQAMNRSGSPQDRIEALLDLQDLLLPQIFEEAYAVAPDTDRSVVIARANNVLKDMAGSIDKSAAISAGSKINPQSDRFRAIFIFLMKEIRHSLSQTGVAQDVLDTFFHILGDRLAGLEEKIERINDQPKHLFTKDQAPADIEFLQQVSQPVNAFPDFSLESLPPSRQ